MSLRPVKTIKLENAEVRRVRGRRFVWFGLVGDLARDLASMFGRYGSLKINSEEGTKRRKYNEEDTL